MSQSAKIQQPDLSIQSPVFYPETYAQLKNRLPHLDFSTNWNNKLELAYFPTYRVDSGKYVTIGQHYFVKLKTNPLGIVKLIETRSIPPDKITDFMAFLDTGYNAEEFHKILLSMYGATYRSKPFQWLLFRWEEKFPPATKHSPIIS
jgi:hypothetical protein